MKYTAKCEAMTQRGRRCANPVGGADRFCDRHRTDPQRRLYRVLIGWASAPNLQSVADQNRKKGNPHWPLNVAPDRTLTYCFPLYAGNPPE